MTVFRFQIMVRGGDIVATCKSPRIADQVAESIDLFLALRQGEDGRPFAWVVDTEAKT